MKSALKICIGVICFFLSANVFCQAPPPQIAHIKNYKVSIDSLYNICEAGHFNGESEFKEFIEEGYYLKKGRITGGYSVYSFSAGDTILRIHFNGGPRRIYIKKYFYYENGRLVYSEMTLGQSKSKTNKPYIVQEYYQDNKLVEKSTTNTWPAHKKMPIKPVSLYEEGMTYFNKYNKKQ